jgi:hypothetical protein
LFLTVQSAHVNRFAFSALRFPLRDNRFAFSALRFPLRFGAGVYAALRES